VIPTKTKSLGGLPGKHQGLIPVREVSDSDTMTASLSKRYCLGYCLNSLRSTLLRAQGKLVIPTKFGRRIFCLWCFVCVLIPVREVSDSDCIFGPPTSMGKTGVFKG